jgi:hypothetical protein
MAEKGIQKWGWLRASERGERRWEFFRNARLKACGKIHICRGAILDGNKRKEAEKASEKENPSKGRKIFYLTEEKKKDISCPKCNLHA